MHGIGGVPLSSLGGAFHGGYFAKVLATGPIAYWPLWEASGTTARCLVNPTQNGTYSSNVSTWPVGAGIGDGNTAPQFDGANDYVDIYTVPFRDAFSGSEGTLFAWAKVSGIGVWTDATARSLFRLLVDGNNYIWVYKSNAANTLGFEYRAGGVLETQFTAGMTTTDWFSIAMTWSASNDRVIYYLNGATTGATDVGLGVWAGLLGVFTTLLGATNQVPVNPWSGGMAHASIYDRELSGATIANLAQL